MDKSNRVDFHWYVMRTQPCRESRLTQLLGMYRQKQKNILDVYAPTNTRVFVGRSGEAHPMALFAGVVFVLATNGALRDFMDAHALGEILQYERKRSGEERTRLRIIPEEQMRAFRDFNENYADKVILLERPYTDYAFNTKTQQPNDLVRVIDGPLAGHVGYVCKFRRDKSLVFQVQGIEPGSHLTVSYPNIWDLHVVRVRNAEEPPHIDAMQKERAIDLLMGILQGTGHAGDALTVFNHIVAQLVEKPSLVKLCNALHRQGDEPLARRIAQMTAEEAELIINLVRFERDNPGYLAGQAPSWLIRPFLTATPGVAMPNDRQEAAVMHKDFTEVIRRIEISEDVYRPSTRKMERHTNHYFAHVGIMPPLAPTAGTEQAERGYVVFANWNAFLTQYFLTGGKANEKLVSGIAGSDKQMESFRNFAPTLYNILANPCSEVKAVEGLRIGDTALNVMAIETAGDIETAKQTLIQICLKVCREITATTHLAVWRNYLRTVWLR